MRPANIAPVLMRCQIRQSSINGCGEQTGLGADPGLRFARANVVTRLSQLARPRQETPRKGLPPRWCRPPSQSAKRAGGEGGRRKAPQGDEPSYAALSQYPALNGLLMRNARGDTSTSLSVGIYSSGSAAISIRWTLGTPLTLVRPFCLAVGCRTGYKRIRNTGREFCRSLQ